MAWSAIYVKEENMRAFKHKEHNVYSISKNAVIIRRKVGGRIKFFFPKAVKRYGLIGSVKNFKLYIRPHKEWRFWYWLIRFPFFYWARHNGGFEIGFPNLYLWIIR